MQSHSALRPPPPKSILLVDDDPSMRRALTHMLREGGYAVTAANDGTAALRLLATSTYDLLIVDIFTPNQDGFDVIGVLRRQPRKIPSLAISGGGVGTDGSEALRQAKLLGADAILEKPFGPTELLQAVGALLGART